MKLKTLLFSFMLLFAVQSASAKGGIPILYSEGDDVVKVLDLPQSEDFQIQAQDGKWYHADLGILHEQFSIFFIPLFNYGTEKYVLYTDTKIGDFDFIYADLDREDINYLQSQFAGIPDVPELPFWDAWGGKLVALLIIIVLFFFKS